MLTHPHLRRVIGPPGCGKTHYLLDIVEKEMKAGTKPEKIAFVSFTKKAATEAKERAMERFGYKDGQLPWFRTIHSLVFKQMGYNRKQVVQAEHLDDLGSNIGTSFKGFGFSEDGVMETVAMGHRLLFLENLSRVTGKPIRKVWQESDHGTEWGELELFQRAYCAYKAQKYLIDFSDMIEAFIREQPTPNIDVMLVDEAQDLSLQQWRVIEILAKRCRVVYVVGDPDQSIYRWSGADTDDFVNLQPSRETVLDQSYRIPSSVHSLAMEIIGRVKDRRKVVFKPRAAAGKVDVWSTIEDVDISTGKWLLLARNDYLLKPLQQLCQQNGYPFERKDKSPLNSKGFKAIRAWEHLRKTKTATLDNINLCAEFWGDNMSSAYWHQMNREHDAEDYLSTEQLVSSYKLKTTAVWHEALNGLNKNDRDFFLAARRRGEKLLEEPRIKINTIHGVKGGEADNVLLLSDISKITHESMQKNPDDEARVFYVGVTRAMETLHIVQPRTNLYYEL